MVRRYFTISVLCLVSALVATPGKASAQQSTTDDKSVLDLILPSDGTELQLQGATSIALNDNQKHSGTIFGSYGWFITKRQQVGASAVVTIRDSGDFNGDGNGGFKLTGFGGPFYRYNLLTGKVAPYVGGSLAFTFGDYGNGVQGPSNYLLELEVGSRWFLRRDVSFNASAGILYDVDQSELSDSIDVRFGFSYFWQ